VRHRTHRETSQQCGLGCAPGAKAIGGSAETLHCSKEHFVKLARRGELRVREGLDQGRRRLWAALSADYQVVRYYCTGRRVDRDDRHLVSDHRRGDVHHAVRDYRGGLKACSHSGLHQRHQTKRLHAVRRNLLERRIALVATLPAAAARSQGAQGAALRRNRPLVGGDRRRPLTPRASGPPLCGGDRHRTA